MENMQKNSVARARLQAFFDQATFVELGAYVRRPTAPDEAEGVVTGYGAVQGRLVFAFAQDISAMKGAVDGRHAEKIAALYAKALSVGAPVVAMLDSTGVLVFEGAAALGGYGLLLRTVAEAAGVVPQIALISGTCKGTLATLAALFDFVVLDKQAPAPAGVQAALIADGEAEAFDGIRALLRYLPDDSISPALPASPYDDPNRALSLQDRTTAAEALAALVDGGTYLSLFGGAAPTVQVGLAMLGEISCVVIAADGMLDGCGAAKMTKMLSFADDFGLPVVTLLNCEGVAEGEAAVLAALARTQSASTTARVTVIVGSAVGAGFILGGTRGLGADMVLALPDAEIAALSARTAVAFFYHEKITADVSREALEAKWKSEQATALAAAAQGEVDDIVAPCELRARVIAALYMLHGKDGRAPRFL